MKKSQGLISAVDGFWEVVPVVWRQTRAYVRQIASERHHLSVEQFQVLRRIRRGVVTVSTLADVGLSSLSAASKTVDTLVNQGLVIRMPSTEDRRVIYLELTSAGEDMLSKVYDETRQWMMEKFIDLSAEELAALTKGLAVLLSAFQEGRRK